MSLSIYLSLCVCTNEIEKCALSFSFLISFSLLAKVSIKRIEIQTYRESICGNHISFLLHRPFIVSMCKLHSRSVSMSGNAICACQMAISARSKEHSKVISSFQFHSSGFALHSSTTFDVRSCTFGISRVIQFK